MIKGQADEVERVEIQPHETGGYVIRVHLRNDAEELFAYDPTRSRRTVAGLGRSPCSCVCAAKPKAGTSIGGATD
jgi:hypothetical protein